MLLEKLLKKEGKQFQEMLQGVWEIKVIKYLSKDECCLQKGKKNPKKPRINKRKRKHTFVST